MSAVRGAKRVVGPEGECVSGIEAPTLAAGVAGGVEGVRRSLIAWRIWGSETVVMIRGSAGTGRGPAVP